MKLSTVLFAGLMTLTSAAAFAEGGSERSREFYNNFTFLQKEAHSTTEQTASTDTNPVKYDSAKGEQPKS